MSLFFIDAFFPRFVLPNHILFCFACVAALCSSQNKLGHVIVGKFSCLLPVLSRG